MIKQQLGVCKEAYCTPECVTVEVAVLDEGSVLWKRGDQVSIFAGRTLNEQYQVTEESGGQTTAGFTVVSSSPGFSSSVAISNNVAYYPYSTVNSLRQSGSVYELSTKLPAVQRYAQDSFGPGAFPMTAVTTSTSDYNLKFKHVLGGVKLQLKGNAKIASISISGNAAEPLCGAAKVCFEAGGVPSIELTDATATTVTLDCGDGVQLSDSEATSFVIALPPMSMPDGFTVTVKDTDGKMMVIPTVRSQTITRSSLLIMPVVEYEGTDAGLLEPFTITSKGSTTVAFVKDGSPDPVTLEYRVGNGAWSSYTIGSGVSLADGESVQFRAGEAGNEYFSMGYFGYYNVCVNGSGKFSASGNIMSLLDRTMKRDYLSVDVFSGLFRGCARLADASSLILPATTLASGCYEYMFSGCTGLKSAPELPATTLAGYCYCHMFEGCTGLTAAPELPATTLAKRCYNRMFEGCTGLTYAPELPATTLADNCYYVMFGGCTGLTAAPALPATTLANDCYESMFNGCTGLTAAPELPATTLANRCYFGMFYGCTGLTSAPELPATTLADYCYVYMFSGCTGLKSAPELPATTLTDHCYSIMFRGCTGLTSAPELPATTLAYRCYPDMFSGCTGLTSAPELPATTLAKCCYHRMFSGCTGLTAAPELPATTLAIGCYDSMFQGCTNLNYVKALFTTTPGSDYTSGWLSGVASTGTFVKSKDATWDVRGVNGIPEGWDVEIDGEVDPAKRPFTITSKGSTTVAFVKQGLPDQIALEYRVGNGAWSSYTIGSGVSLADGESVQFRAGEAGNAAFSNAYFISDNEYHISVSGTGTVSASGNIMSLLDRTMKRDYLSDYVFSGLFRGCARLVDASSLILPATTLAYRCYNGMFMGCTGLTSAPELPATTLAYRCYDRMFYGCIGLKSAPELPATTLASECYISMFFGCTGLTAAPELPATTLKSQCYEYMFKGCTGLKSAPELPATTLKSQCYENMFGDCTGLTSAPELPATTLADYCYRYMFYGCTGLTAAPELPATTLAHCCYADMFSGCTGLTSAPELPATTLANGCYADMFSGCTNLNYVKALFTTIPGNDYLSGWLYGVASTGTFVKSKKATWDVRGVNGIPEGWDVEIDGEVDPAKRPFTITSKGSTTVAFVKQGSPNRITLEYRVGNGAWSSYTIGSGVSLADGESVQFRAGEVGNAAFSKAFNGGYNEYHISVRGTGTVSASGNIMSLLDRTMKRDYLSDYVFSGLFRGCARLVDASSLLLPMTTLAKYCYSDMFEGCTGLIAAPELPATTLADACYFGMFSRCTGLKSAPELPATTLASRCYYVMFGGCTGLTSAPELPATTLAEYCYDRMFEGCTGLTAAPKLPATTLADYCYADMFRFCTGLKSAPELPATTLKSRCYENMFWGCTGLKSAPELPATNLARDCYNRMFFCCTNLNYVKALFTTILGLYYTSGWLYGVASTGTFVKSKKATWDVRGVDGIGIPEGWKVITTD